MFQRVRDEILSANRTAQYMRDELPVVIDDDLPIVTYDDIEPFIERVCAGESNVLTSEPVLMVEKTSGSTAAAKYIPYTRSLRRQFQPQVCLSLPAIC